MGLLDDAIREHLDLKRKHGAPEEELQRQEEEALGPARRDVSEGADADSGNGAMAQEVGAAEAVQEVAVQDPAPPEAPTEFLAPDPEPAAEVHAESPPERAAPLDSEAPEESEPPSSAAALADEPGQATEEYDPFADDEPFAEKPAAADEPDEEDPDVLEDTPEFLQETPEHDRLWFEQKPPRDFDFD